MNGLFLNQKTNKSIRISYSLKYKHWKKIIYGKINDSVAWNKHSWEQYYWKLLCKGATFVKKNSCLVARIVSFDTVKSWNSIFLNSEFFLLTRGFHASTRAFNLLTRAFNLAARAFSLLTRRFELITCEFELVTRGFELETRKSSPAFYFSTIKCLSLKHETYVTE